MSPNHGGRKDVFQLMAGPELQFPILTSGEVVNLLGIDMPRLERFLENYPLSAGQPGRGKGSRRLFSAPDIQRLAIAKWLLDDGFQPALVAEIMEELSDSDLIDYDENGEKYLSLALERDPISKKRTHSLIYSRSGVLKATKAEYYILNLHELVTDVDKRINRTLQNRGQS